MQPFEMVRTWFQHSAKPDSASDRVAITLVTRTSSRPSGKRLAMSRRILSPILLLLVVNILILSFIYSYSATKPHSNEAAATADSTSTLEGSYHEDSSLWGAYNKIRRDETQTLASAIAEASATPVAPSEDTTPAPLTPSNATPNATESMTALVFYSFTLPSLQVVVSAVEIITFFHLPELLTRKMVHYMVMGVTAMMLTGWIIQNAVWTHCELVNPNSHMSPAQLHDHENSMTGMRGFSIAKIVLTWFVICGLAAHLAFQVMQSKRSRRTWAVESGGNEFTEEKSERVSVEGYEPMAH